MRSNNEQLHTANPAAETAVNERVYRRFIENLPVMFYAVAPDPPHRPIYISPTFERFGYPLRSWFEDPDIWDKVIHPDDRDRVLTATRKAMRTRGSVDFEYRVICSDGRVVWVRDRSCFIRDDDGSNLCWQGVILDITDRRNAEEALAESEERYRQLFDNANDVIYLQDLKGNYLSINQAATKIFGYSRDEAIGLNMKDIMVPEHLEMARKALESKIAGEVDQTVYAIDCIKKDGSRITLEVNTSVIRKDGQPIAIQGVARDITERKRVEDAIRKSEERFRDLIENANDLIYTCDLDGNFTSLNRAGERITGYTRDEALSMNIAQVIDPDFLDLTTNVRARRLAASGAKPFEVEIIAKNGERVILELSTRVIISSDGLPLGVQGIGRDITERRRAETSLRETLSLFSTTFESTADGIVVMSLDRQIVTCNRKFIEMWDVPEDVLKNKDGAMLVALVAQKLRDPNGFIERLSDLYETPDATVSEIIELSDGRIFERYSTPQYLEGKAIGRVASFRDITERNRAEERLRYYALHDPLTGLPNRVQFMNDLRQAVERSDGNDFARFAVLFLDLDRFKVINDSLGHSVGDKLLIAVAEKLKSCVRPGDVVARLGGDEFTILLNRSGTAQEVARVAERLQRTISEPLQIDNYEVFTTASIGVVVSGAVKRVAEDFLRDADAAMYRAKESGKARYEIFDREMHVRNMNLLQIETDLRRAVERGEFEVLYQPIVDLRTGVVNEFEALIRWRHPAHGLVTPNEFVQVAEETGLIIPIGKWILAESCRQIAEWQQRFDRELSVSVNLSAKQLMHPNLSEQIRSVLAEMSLDASQLKLEVTESTVMEHSERSMKVLSELDELGVSLSTDDFGTGFSSLSYLQRFPFDRLKIDRSFVKLMDDDNKSGLIVKTILMLGENLDIEVVAEGIETCGQLQKLRELGCTLGQGYLFSHPIDPRAAGDLLATGPNVFSSSTSVLPSIPSEGIDVGTIQ